MNRCFIVNLLYIVVQTLLLVKFSLFVFFMFWKVFSSQWTCCTLCVKHFFEKGPFISTFLVTSLFFSFLWLPCPLLSFCSPPSRLLPVRRVPPRFSIPPTSQEIMPGASVNITCVAVGSPMPYVKWMLNSEDLTPEDEMPVGRNVLELSSVRESANYTCVAMSSLGIIEAVAQITVKCKRLL